MSSKRLNSRWKYIFVVDDQKNDATCFELNELGRIKKDIQQPKKIFMKKKFNSSNKVIKELVLKAQYAAKNPVLSFSGNIEIFSKEQDNEFIMNIMNDAETEKEKYHNESAENGKNSPNTEKNHCNIFNYFNFDDMLQSDIELDDFY